MLKFIKSRKTVLVTAVFTAAAFACGGVIASDTQAEAQQPLQTPAPLFEITASPTAHIEREELHGIMNILLIGTDERVESYDDRGRGDVTMLCSLDMDEKTVRLISFERSTGMPWAGHGDIMLSSTFAYGGPELTVNAISSRFDIPIDAYVHVDFEGFARIIDAIGGIDIYLTAEEANAINEDMWYDNVYSEGDCHLNGESALRYCRLRRIDDNWHRVQRQRNAIQAVISKAKTLRVAGIKKLAEVAIPLTDTDLTGSQLVKLIFAAPKFAGVQTEQMTVPDRSRIWTYEGEEGAVTGCDRSFESARIKEFIYRKSEVSSVFSLG